MKVRFYHWYNAVLTALLSMLGYGCSSDPMREMEMYGCPTADYIVKGQVTDEVGAPVQGVKTSLKQRIKTDAGTVTFGIDSIQTNETGSYQFKSMDNWVQDIKLIVEDIDGEANGGEFLSDTLDIDFGKAVQTKKGDGEWYGGVFEITQDVKLKKKP